MCLCVCVCVCLCVCRRVSCRKIATAPNPTPHTVHPTPYTHTLHPTHYTIHPTPYYSQLYTLHPNPGCVRVGGAGGVKARIVARDRFPYVSSCITYVSLHVPYVSCVLICTGADSGARSLPICVLICHICVLICHICVMCPYMYRRG